MTYGCNDCGAQFDDAVDGVCPQCGSADIFIEDAENLEETKESLEDVVAEADDKNKKGFAMALRTFGEQYIQYKNSLERAKMCIKDTLEMAKGKGITKDMLLAYASAVQLEDFNAKVLCSAVQQELGMEEVAEETTEAAEETTETSTGEDSDVQQEEQSDNQGNE